MREWNGKLERVMVIEEGFASNGQTFGSLSQIAKAMTETNWNGHRFFGLRQGKTAATDEATERRSVRGRDEAQVRGMAASSGDAPPSRDPDDQTQFCAARSTAGLDRRRARADFNSLDAQREACEAMSRVRRMRAGSDPGPL